MSAATPTTALATVLRTGTAVRPAPGCSASRMPSMAVTEPMAEVTAVARSCGLRRPPGGRGRAAQAAQPAALAARQVGQAVAATVTSTVASGAEAEDEAVGADPRVGLGDGARPTGTAAEIASAGRSAAAAPAAPIAAARRRPDAEQDAAAEAQRPQAAVLG